MFEHDPGGETFTRISRGDGVVLGIAFVLAQVSRSARPRTRRSLGLSGGIFGCIAAGGVFDNMTVLRGNHATPHGRSRRVVKAASGTIAVAESLVGVVHRAVEHRRRPPFTAVPEAWGVVRAEPYLLGVAEIRRAVELLAELVGV